MFQLLVTAIDIVPSLPIVSTLMTVAILSPEMSLLRRSTSPKTEFIIVFDWLS
jgi:hypothetical protein